MIEIDKKTKRLLKAMGRKARKIAGKKYGYSLMRKLILEDRAPLGLKS